ncbi:MAG: NAD(P)-binding domain-containing protein [Corynebacterium sp.]|uniref:NADPH-dependent F420 reductase n=1 Tax=Corynebacterium sp. TaxID=1720 RepID=UPI00264948D3|nr:NAD(P)-binding domain-containing protein [Corynebacterium sp.]MDN5723387.1 NAD(P)-binding domain-containing protein [Corynebacterium sp.]MDN6281559.1 NAD(P)-binding domain-containing protein [Corynebacterium sp.]MDN6305148.1 NAD(P)-binding domain-containing protein [Corynebacterium sp.]MDN6367381.1 NAD(P)-binding domain-containing protein [Corynebacterium sp.]MDN6374884.1 NAD(P)-binding domain-containing protein [Corynebacterium sp.]
MSTIGIIGSGLIGATVARLAIEGDHQVVLSNSREPRTLLPLVAALGPNARAATPAEAAEAGDIVVVSVPLGALADIPAEPLAGKTVIDTSNYYWQRDGHIDALDNREVTTSAYLQERLPESSVVKAFNNINFAHLGLLARPADSPERTSLVIAGDDEDAKAEVTSFLDSLGYNTLDAGPLSEGRRFDNGQPAYGRPYLTPDANPTDILSMGPGRPATDEELRDALSAADLPD